MQDTPQIPGFRVERLLGAGAYGFEAASQRYFGKSARQVNPAEAAMLAGLLKAPSRYAPTSDLQQSRARASPPCSCTGASTEDAAGLGLLSTSLPGAEIGLVTHS